MARLYFITHPQVVIDPARPVPNWHLSDAGIAQIRRFAQAFAFENLTSIWASTETKAIETAGILAAAHGLPVSVDARLTENDRSATGFLPPERFQQVADRFFAEPQNSVLGWERAVDAQARVVAGFAAITAGPPQGDIAICAHGGVGTLLYCHLAGYPISRRYDQRKEGHYWVYDLARGTMESGWQSL